MGRTPYPPDGLNDESIVRRAFAHHSPEQLSVRISVSTRPRETQILAEERKEQSKRGERSQRSSGEWNRSSVHSGRAMHPRYSTQSKRGVMHCTTSEVRLTSRPSTFTVSGSFTKMPPSFLAHSSLYSYRVGHSPSDALDFLRYARYARLPTSVSLNSLPKSA